MTTNKRHIKCNVTFYTFAATVTSTTLDYETFCKTLRIVDDAPDQPAQHAYVIGLRNLEQIVIQT